MVEGGASFQGGAIIDSLDNINGFSAGVGVDITCTPFYHNPRSKTNTHCSRNTTSASTIIVTPFIKTTTSNQCMPSYFYTRTSIKTTYNGLGVMVEGGASFQGGAIIDSLDNINGFSAGVGVDIGIGSVQGGNISVKLAPPSTITPSPKRIHTVVATQLPPPLS
jgi:hypothetical protein